MAGGQVTKRCQYLARPRSFRAAIILLEKWQGDSEREEKL